jgi:hypothetical protein
MGGRKNVLVDGRRLPEIRKWKQIEEGRGEMKREIIGKLNHLANWEIFWSWNVD